MICYLDCSQNDCCHNKGGSCCLGGVKVHHAGQSDAVCRSYRNNEAYANAATDNAPPSAETAVRCDRLPPQCGLPLPRAACAH